MLAVTAVLEVLFVIALRETALVPLPIKAYPEVKLVVPVPPLPTPRVPVTPGVTLALPSKLAAEVEAKFVWIVLAVWSWVAVEAFPFNVAVIVPAEKFPLESLWTIVEPVFEFVA